MKILVTNISSGLCIIKHVCVLCFVLHLIKWTLAYRFYHGSNTLNPDQTAPKEQPDPVHSVFNIDYMYLSRKNHKQTSEQMTKS